MATRGTGRALGAFALTVLLCLPAGTLAGTPTAQARGGGNAGCGVLGVYHVGRTIPPLIVNPPAGSGQNSVTPTTAIAYPILGFGSLTGTITLAAYAACGSSTLGNFSVAVSRYPGPVAMTPGDGSSSNTVGSGSGTTNPPSGVPIITGTTVLTATGTFSRNASHAGDRSYVSVDATVTYGRYSLGCPPLCAVQPGLSEPFCVPNGCQTGETISRISVFREVTGYLSVQAGNPASLALVFLPPPDPKAVNPSAAIAALQPISLSGLRAGT